MFRSIAISSIMFLSFESCAVYWPAVWDSSVPVSHPPGKSTSGTAVSADVNKRSGYNSHESNYLARATYVSISSHDWWNAGLGAYTYGGLYRVTQHRDTALHGQNFYYGLGPYADVNIFLTYKKFNFGTGVFVGWAFEFGSYTRTYSEDARHLLGYPLGGQQLFIQYNIGDQSNVALQLFEGIPPGLGVLQFSYFHEQIGGWLSIRPLDRAATLSLGATVILR